MCGWVFMCVCALHQSVVLRYYIAIHVSTFPRATNPFPSSPLTSLLHIVPRPKSHSNAAAVLCILDASAAGNGATSQPPRTRRGCPCGSSAGSRACHALASRARREVQVGVPLADHLRDSCMSKKTKCLMIDYNKIH